MSDVSARAPEQSAADEAYRILRSTVKFAAGDLPLRSVLVVDLDRDEPSGVAMRLGEAFARAGDRCVVVDTDLRTTNGDPGFNDLIGGSADARTVARAQRDGLALIGPGTAGTPDALAGDEVSSAIATLLEQHEFAIFSAASLPANGDALALAPRMDAVILVVTAGKTRRGRAVEARDALDRVGANVLGVVMAEPRKRRFR